MSMPAELPPLRLHPGLNPSDFAKIYAEKKIVQIPGIFEPELAKEIERVLQTLPWRLCYHDPQQGVVQLTNDDLRKLGQQGLNQRMKKVMELATRNYGYCYNTYQMNEAKRDHLDPEHPVHKITEFLNSPEFMEFGAEVIGEAGTITNVDCHATLYTRGSFLTRHIDDGAMHERRCAYTLGFTENWMTDWGGITLFLDKNTDIEEGYLPRWNMLTLFDGRRIHSVSAISAFAGRNRLSVTGWLRND